MFMVQLSLYSLQFGLHNKLFPSLDCMQQYLCIEKRMDLTSNRFSTSC